VEILRYAAFTADPSGGNPAGVVLDAAGFSDARMQSIAAEVGYSETAFLTGPEGNAHRVRYFSPLAEVPFCGHATIAAAVAYAERFGAGQLQLVTNAGLVSVVTLDGGSATGVVATLVSVPPRSVELSSANLDALLATLRWRASDLDPTLPARVAYAGAWHPIIAAATRDRLARLDYDFGALGQLMAEREWTTVQLVWRESERVFHSRNPFPPGGVIEDPATGAAATALGGYLRELQLVGVPATVIVHQGDDLGRPSVLEVSISAEPGSGVAVTGRAVRIPH
jgi:PhzF family phenazine biosynthesis protein